MRYRYHKEDGTEDNITIDKSGIYHLPASVKLQKNFGFYCNPQTVTEEATIEILPTSILKDFSGNGLDAYMIQREVIVNKLVEFYTGKIDELANQNALIMIFRPFIDKAADKSISKVDKFLKMIQEEDGTVDIEPLLGKMTDNLIVAATKEYPDLFGGVTIGNGKIKIGVPGIDKDIVLEAADIDHFKSCLK